MNTTYGLSTLSKIILRKLNKHSMVLLQWCTPPFPRGIYYLDFLNFLYDFTMM